MLSPLRSALRGGSGRLSDTLKTRPSSESHFQEGLFKRGADPGSWRVSHPLRTMQFAGAVIQTTHPQ